MASSGKNVLTRKTIAESWHNITKNTTTEEVFFQWTIRNFLDCPIKEPGVCLKSTAFHTNDNTRWRLLLYPKGSGEIYADYVSLYFLLEDTNDDRKVNTERKCSILNRSKKKTNVTKGNAPFIQGTKWGHSTFIERKVLIDEGDDLLPDGHLTIHCEIKLKHDQKKSHPVLVANQPDCDTSKSFGNFFNNPLFSDITFDIKGKEIFAHKIILSVHSPKFFAIICSKAKENDQNRIEVADIPYEVMEDILRFIYTGKKKRFKTAPDDLLRAAKSYGLEKLQEICEKQLASTSPV